MYSCPPKQSRPSRFIAFFPKYYTIETEALTQGAISLRCGEKCFFVEAEIDGERIIKPVNARTPALARKTLRKAYGKGTPILAVKRKKR